MASQPKIGGRVIAQKHRHEQPARAGSDNLRKPLKGFGSEPKNGGQEVEMIKDERPKVGRKLAMQQALPRRGLFGRVEDGLKQAIAHQRGEKVEGIVVHNPKITTADKLVSTPKPERKKRAEVGNTSGTTGENGGSTKREPPVSLRLPPALLAAIDAEAKACDMSRSALIAEILRERFGVVEE